MHVGQLPYRFSHVQAIRLSSRAACRCLVLQLSPLMWALRWQPSLVAGHEAAQLHGIFESLLAAMEVRHPLSCALPRPGQRCLSS